MVIKTFKFSNKNIKYKYYNDEDEIILSPSRVREVLVNKYLSLVKEKISKQSEISYDDSNIEIKITTDNDSIQYDIVFSGIDSLPVIKPTEFIVNNNSDPTPDPDPSPDPDQDSVERTGRIITADDSDVYGLSGITITLVYKDNLSESSHVTKTATSNTDGYYSLTIPSYLQTADIVTFVLSGPECEARTINLDGCQLTEYVADYTNYPTIPDIPMNVKQGKAVGQDSSEAILIGGYVIDNTSHEPIAGARVTLSSDPASTSTSPVYTTTNAIGFFRFNEGQLRTVTLYELGDTNYSGTLTVSQVGYSTCTNVYSMEGETWWTREQDGTIELTKRDLLN